ncbi:hypothetical protein [Flagellimonas marinaquae]
MAVESRVRAGTHAQSITFSEYILSKKRFGQDLQIIIFEKKVLATTGTKSIYV